MGPCRIGMLLLFLILPLLLFASLSAKRETVAVFAFVVDGGSGGKSSLVHEIKNEQNVYINRYERAFARSHFHSSSLLTLTLDTGIIIKLCSALLMRAFVQIR